LATCSTPGFELHFGSSSTDPVGEVERIVAQLTAD
jgi:hypothetical protein